MSDGTLRALGVLVAVFQSRVEDVPSALLAGIEEPEVAPHPAAVGALLDALREARRSTQVRVTTHSPDLLDLASLETGLLLVIYADRGATQIAPIDEASRKAVRKGLYTAGEFLRLDQLRREPCRQFPHRLPLWGAVLVLAVGQFAAFVLNVPQAVLGLTVPPLLRGLAGLAIAGIYYLLRVPGGSSARRLAPPASVT